MKTIETLTEQYKNNFTKLERATKEERKAEQKKKEIETEQTENFYNLQDKKIDSSEYLKKCDLLKKELEKAREKEETATIERKLLQDNETIIIDKIIVDIYKNILKKYENKNIGEATTAKIDGEIKEHLKDIFNNKYIEITPYNEYRGFLPNQFINLFTPEYSFSNYQKKLCFYITSKYGTRSQYQQKIYIKDNQFLFNEYSKAEEIEKDNAANIERIEKTEIEEDSKKKAKEILKSYNKKKETLEKIRKQEEQAKRDFDRTIQNNQERFYHNLYEYFYR